MTDEQFQTLCNLLVDQQAMIFAIGVLIAGVCLYSLFWRRKL